MRTIDFAKGHGTLNDFVLVPDLDGSLDLSETDVRFLADRHAGIGGDGVIRVAPLSAAPADVREAAPDAQWFMDYRNADGSEAEMCGNGTRVFAQFLADRALVDAVVFPIATRAGRKVISRVEHGFRTDLGPWLLSRADEARGRGMDSVVQVVGAPDPLPALSLDLGNPHTVVALPPSISLEHLDLSVAPRVDPEPPHGSNVEFVRAIGARHISMRVHERGVGETLSCGTGAAAAALATWWWAGTPSDELTWRVDVRGGTLMVDIDGGSVGLAGPAQIVAAGQVSLPD
ncbi:diaminopimelate epimerase [Branchiibius hedensis]|uniref:Diaminopimelate epimerase n=1 Tax=Branchiibius hedensis TaxID=672460 RepID=A0A2Y8ZTC4_9MICO|nr:diaminopimelate epimerase [Branchiibius hedensis]PWJ24672.1 diaminopimelate epimerase [Branchiibius hedensis]SSA33489.1 diaminopimelate epimerase [Branchiibius hedensis]